MKGSYKRIAAITLSLAMIAGNFLTTSNALTAKALTVTAAEAQGKDESYYDTETQTLHLKGYVKNSNDGSGIILPDSIDKNEVLYIVAEEGTVLPVNCSHLCEGFIHILSMDFSKADTSNVTDMSYMFMPFEDISNCYSLGVCCYGIDVSNFDTSNVTTMKGMFKNCIEVPELDLSSFDTSKVTDMSEMFSCCGYYYYEGPQSLDLSSFDTSEVKDMSKMFYECEALREIDLSRFDTSNVTDMSDMFNSCRHLLTFDLSNFDTSKVTNMKDMFCNCTDLNSLNISSFNTSKVTNMSGMFQQCYSLKNADLSNFNTSQVTDMSRMFYVNVLFKDIDVSSFDTSNVTDMNFMFSNCVSLESLDLRNFDTHKVTDMRYMFDNCRRLKFVDLSSFDTRNVSNMYCMFNGDSVLETIMVGQEWSTELASGNNMFSSCNSLVGGAGTSYDANHEGLEYAHVDGGKDDPGYFTFKEYKKDESYFEAETGTLHLKGYVKNRSNGSGMVLPSGVEKNDIKYVVAEKGTVLPENCSHLFNEMEQLKSIDLKNADTSYVTDMSYMFMIVPYENFVLTSVDVSNFDTKNVTTMKGMFSWSGIDCIDLTSFDTSNVTDMSDMFAYCFFTSYIVLTSFDTSNVTDMSSMFSNCWGLYLLDLSSFNTSKVTDMAFMFSWSGVTSLDLRNFDTSNVTEMACMFEYCVLLDTICVGDKWSTANIGGRLSEKYSSEFYERNNDDRMFYACGSLVGEAGTVYDHDKHDSEYARIDGGKDNPGYLSRSIDKVDKSYFDAKTQTLHLSGYVKTSYACIRLPIGVKDEDVLYVIADEGTVLPDCCSYLFSSLENVRSIDLKNADASNVVDMSSMFYLFDDDTPLSEIDLRGIDTSNVTNMSSMFRSCSSLDSLDLSSFDTSKVTNMKWMFRDCNNLSKIYVGSGWSTESAEGNEMFDGCESLVGGAGTAYDADHVDVDYAHVDGGKNDPGYLTFKENDFFKTQNLILSGQIGVSFNLDLSSLTDQERNASYMEFKINGRTSIVPFDKNSKNASGKYYSFTCYVTSVEMADTITATFHYGNGNMIYKKYSVLDYINAIEKNAENFDNKTLYLIRSIADYGHYSQPFLAASNNWTIGSEHMEMSKHYTSSYSYDAIRNVISKYQRVLDLGKSDIEKISYSLSLNSGTSLNVFIKAKSNYKGSVKVTVKKGNTVTSYTAVKQADGRYKVTIPDISAHQLGDTYTITAETTNGTATCSLSALSYVYAVLNENSDNTAKNAVSSLYIYYDATLNYRSKA